MPTAIENKSCLKNKSKKSILTHTKTVSLSASHSINVFLSDELTDECFVLKS